jgi:hypothetical protein
MLISASSKALYIHASQVKHFFGFLSDGIFVLLLAPNYVQNLFCLAISSSTLNIIAYLAFIHSSVEHPGFLMGCTVSSLSAAWGTWLCCHFSCEISVQLALYNYTVLDV